MKTGMGFMALDGSLPLCRVLPSVPLAERDHSATTIWTDDRRGNQPTGEYQMNSRKKRDTAPTRPRTPQRHMSPNKNQSPHRPNGRPTSYAARSAPTPMQAAIETFRQTAPVTSPSRTPEDGPIVKTPDKTLLQRT